MSAPTDSNLNDMGPNEAHVLAWNDRLQEWLDGDLSDADRRAVDAHLATCSICPDQLEELRELDTLLSAAAPRLSLDAAFDARLMLEVDAFDHQQRARLRQKLEQERQQQLQSLSRRWKQSLAFVIPGVVAALALIFALVASLDHSGLSRSLTAESTGELGRNAALYVQAAFIALIGGGIGLTVARWLSSAAD
jgi:anti-sigma factor RsiW